MVNNEFTVVGVAVSNYESIANSEFDSYLLRIEVEKLGIHRGKTFEVVVQIYANNHAVDLKENVLGKIVVVNGFLDTYTTKKGTALLKAVAQNVLVVGDKMLEKSVVADNIEID